MKSHGLFRSVLCCLFIGLEKIGFRAKIGAIRK